MRNMGYVAVRTTRYKYIHDLELKDLDELYDLEADPYEQRNLAGVAGARPLLAVMQQELTRLMAESEYPAPHPRGQSSRPVVPQEEP